MAEKLENLKENASEFVEDHRDGFIIGVCTIGAVAYCAAVAIVCRKIGKWQAKQIGIEVAKALGK